MTRARTIALALTITASTGLTACVDIVSLGSGDDSPGGGSVEPKADPSLCLTGAITTLADNQNPTDLVVDHDNVYWIDDPGIRQLDEHLPKHVMKAPKSGGAPVVLATGSSISRLMLDDQNVYWTADNGTTPPTDSLFSTPKSGGAITTIVTTGTPVSVVGVDNDSVYLDDVDAATLSSMPRSGGAQTILTATFANDHRILMDAQSLYWTSGNDVFSLPKGGGTPTLLTSALSGDLLSAQDDYSLYFAWKGPGRGTVSVPKSGGAPILLRNGVYPQAVDARCVYEAPWIEGTVEDTNHMVLGAPKSGDVTATMASGLTDVWAMTVDETGLYWTNAYAGLVMKIAR